MITAHFPPFDSSTSVCKCGWMWKTDCDMTSEKCGMKQGMPEYEGHTPYEFLSEWTPEQGEEESTINLDAICREVVEDMIEEKGAVERFHEEVRKRMPSVDWHGPGLGVHPDDGEPLTLEGVRSWVKDGPPGSLKWENTEPATYHNDSRDKQVGGSHYAEMEVQPWDAMRAWMSPEEYAGYQIGTCISYLARHKKKGGLQDLKKAHHHLSELLRYFEEEEEYPW